MKPLHSPPPPAPTVNNDRMLPTTNTERELRKGLTQGSGLGSYYNRSSHRQRRHSVKNIHSKLRGERTESSSSWNCRGRNEGAHGGWGGILVIPPFLKCCREVWSSSASLQWCGTYPAKSDQARVFTKHIFTKESNKITKLNLKLSPEENLRTDYLLTELNK